MTSLEAPQLTAHPTLLESYVRDEIALMEVGSDSRNSLAFCWISNSRLNDMVEYPIMAPIDEQNTRIESECRVLVEGLGRVLDRDYWMVIVLTNSTPLLERIQKERQPAMDHCYPPEEIEKDSRIKGLIDEFEEFYVKQGL